MTERLSKQDWLDHGLKTLAHSGFQGLKADLLCKSLEVSRGSFYWHFKNLKDFHLALLAHWKSVVTEATIDDLNRHTDSSEQLAELMVRAFTMAPGLENAVRSWALHSAAVGQAVATVDTLRINYITKLLSDAGLPERQACARAVFVYAASLGQSNIWSDNLKSLDKAAIGELARILKSA
ncbi:MAG: TetR/AcrR family transcriptional regulator [Lysobacterales bacterium]